MIQDENRFNKKPAIRIPILIFSFIIAALFLALFIANFSRYAEVHGYFCCVCTTLYVAGVATLVLIVGCILFSFHIDLSSARLYVISAILYFIALLIALSGEGWSGDFWGWFLFLGGIVLVMRMLMERSTIVSIKSLFKLAKTHRLAKTGLVKLDVVRLIIVLTGGFALYYAPFRFVINLVGTVRTTNLPACPRCGRPATVDVTYHPRPGSVGVAKVVSYCPRHAKDAPSWMDSFDVLAQHPLMRLLLSLLSIGVGVGFPWVLLSLEKQDKKGLVNSVIGLAIGLSVLFIGIGVSLLDP